MTDAVKHDSGLTTIASRYSVKATIDRPSDVATSAGLLIFGRIDHGESANELGLTLRPTELSWCSVTHAGERH